MKRLSRLILLLTLLPALLLQSSPVLAGDPSAWGEILNPDGSIRWENLQDLGVTSQQVDWTAITLPGGVTFQPDATYHRYMTPSGNILVLPSPMTLFFMALHPEQSNLNGAQSVLQNGAATLAMLVGPSLTSEQLAQIAQLGYTQPQDFFQAVIDGKANIWSVVNLTFLTDVLNASDRKSVV